MRAGRLDLLLQDAETNKRYEVEVQLGKTDEAHIMRCLTPDADDAEPEPPEAA